MDGTTEAIAGFVAELGPGELPERTVHEAKRRLVDSLGCAVGAIDSPPAVIARELASAVTGASPATALGLPAGTTMEMAAFANAVMVRYLDCNDMYFTDKGGGGHPSDMIPTALAVGEAVGASGLDVLRAIVVGYEVNGALAAGAWLRERGWDQGLNIAAATAMMAGQLLGLSSDQLGHALSLAVTPNVPVRQTRIGHLSMWKGCATAGAARNGIFAATLAARGMTGPPDPFEGRSGIWEQVTGPFEVTLPASPDGYAVERAHTKTRPAEYNAQGPLDLMLEVRDRVAMDDVDAIELDTYWLAYHEIGMDAAKWDPTTRETADHSLPYLLAVALVDGFIDRSSCGPERVADRSLRPLMQKIAIRERPDYTERFPQELVCRLAVRLRSGEVVERTSTHPRGHVHNPVSDVDIDEKFDRLVGDRPADDLDVCRRLRDVLWDLDDAKNIAEVMRPLGTLSVDPGRFASAPDDTMDRHG